jgi:hypothetical protein
MSNCANTTIGKTPLIDIPPGNLYLGQTGGLYPDGTNVVPATHIAHGVAISSHLAPINGKVTMGNLGFSVCNMIWDYVMSQGAVDAALSPDLQIVNLAHGGMGSQECADPYSIYWTTHIPAALAAASVDWDDLQVLWVMTSDRADDIPAPAPFPVHAQNLKQQYIRLLRNIRYYFPNVRIVYFTSPPYLGYWDQPGIQQEPFVYENGWGVKWLIQEQIEGSIDINYDPSIRLVRAPWIDWGPYLWCDGVNPNSQGLTWICPDDVQDQGQHPSPTGRAKMAARLIAYWKTHPAAASWFLA